MWITDPFTKLPSVSLTLLIFCTALIVISGCLLIAGQITTLGPFQEMFYSSVALYFGRKLNINGKPFSSDKAEELTKKVE